MAAMTELLTPAQMYQADALAITAGITEAQLIENAGRAVAEEITRRFGARRTVVLCGPGNNGADGKVAARYLKQWGWPVTIADGIEGAELIIDALYGAGLNRDFPAALADKINTAGVPIVSVDVPSGLDGLTGHPRGSCVKADLTITSVSYTHLRAHETVLDLVCRLLLEKKNNNKKHKNTQTDKH